MAVCVLFLAGAAYVYRKIPKERYYYPLLFIILILGAGALGNFIDRIFRGFVVDYIYISLIDFPVFNLADIFVVCGGVLLLIFVFFKYKDDDFEFLKSAKKDD